MGEAWVGGAVTPPLRIPTRSSAARAIIGCGGGHGTHVADIIAGAIGVAPDAQIFAVKVCSSITTSCSSFAMIQGIDLALDPNGDGSTADRVDVINMSIGSHYGQSRTTTCARPSRPRPPPAPSSWPRPATAATSPTRRHPGGLAERPVGRPDGGPVVDGLRDPRQHRRRAVNTRSRLPVLVACRSTSRRRPTSPSSTATAPAATSSAATRSRPGSLTGKVVLVDRGVCNFSAKIANIAAGGGAIGIIGLVTTDDPFDGSLGASCPDNLCAHADPGYMVSQATANAMKNPAARVTFDPANGIPLVGHIVGSSSRGPATCSTCIKPEIGAPGASVSAEVGTGTGTAPFGGTSGAAPMVAGSAALLQDAFPSRGPLEIKAVLINTA